MITLSLEFQNTLMAGSVFGLVISAWLLVMLLISTRRMVRSEKMERRLAQFGDEPGDARVLRLWHDGHEATTMVPVITNEVPKIERLRRLPKAIGWNVPIQIVVLGIIAIATCATVFMFTLTHNVVSSVGAGAIAIVVVWLFIKYQIHARINLFERQLVDALQLIGRSLRAGHPLIGGFELVTEEMDSPVSGVFAEICQQQQLGVSLEEAIRSVAAKYDSPDLRLFATSVVIQLHSGGNLADMMDRLAAVIRERIRLGRRVRVLTAQTQFSKNVLLALPLLLFVLLHTISAAYMEPLYTTSAGHMMIVAALCSMALGASMINRMARLQY